MASNEELKGVTETMKNTCIEMATGGEFNYDKYENDRNKVLAYPELIGLLPDWLVRHRYGSQYWGFISSKFSKYQERHIFLRSEFDTVLEQLEIGSNRPFVFKLELNLKGLNSEIINSNWRKIIQRSQSDPEGAITASRTMLESVMKYILDSEKILYKNTDDFNVLYGKTRKALNLDPTNHNIQTFKQILSGITAVVQGVGSLRNDYGDAHGKGVQNYIPEQRHAELVVNLTGSLCTFIIDTYRTKVTI